MELLPTVRDSIMFCEQNETTNIHRGQLHIPAINRKHIKDKKPYIEVAAVVQMR